MDRVIVIKSNDKELNEAFMELAELFSQGFRIEGKRRTTRIQQGRRIRHPARLRGIGTAA